jgi:hypothetical protein
LSESEPLCTARVPRASERFAALLGLPTPAAPLTADEEAAYHARMRAADDELAAVIARRHIPRAA